MRGGMEKVSNLIGVRSEFLPLQPKRKTTKVYLPNADPCVPIEYLVPLAQRQRMPDRTSAPMHTAANQMTPRKFYPSALQDVQPPII